MGADFTYAILPYAEHTFERAKELHRIVTHLPEDTIADITSFHGIETREEFAELAREYWNLGNKRDVGGLWLEDQIHYILTGGLSWGDSPTDSYKVMAALTDILDVWKALELWASEDYDGRG